VSDAHGGSDDERDQQQSADQRDGLAAVQQPVLQREGNDCGNQGQQQKGFLLEDESMSGLLP
jgi:hypothetical protein